MKRALNSYWAKLTRRWGWQQEPYTDFSGSIHCCGSSREPSVAFPAQKRADAGLETDIPRCMPVQALVEKASMKTLVKSGARNRTTSSQWGAGLRQAVVVAAAICGAAVWCIAHAAPVVAPEKIVEAVTLKGKNLSAVKAVMAVSTEYDGGKSRQDIKGFLLYRRPNDFRFQGVGPGGNSLFELVVKWNSFELYVPSENKILKGGKKCFRQRFPDVAELESLIPLALLQWKQVRFKKLVSRDEDLTVILFTFKDRIWRAKLETKMLRLRRLERLGSSAVDLTADFGDFRSGDYDWLPHRFEVKAPKAGWRTAVRIRKIKFNPFLVEKNFKLDPMFSAKTEDCR